MFNCLNEHVWSAIQRHTYHSQEHKMKKADTYSTSIKQLTVLILKTLLPSQWDLILAVTWPTWCKSYEIQLKLWAVRISKKANNLMWLAHIWLDSECLQSYQAITISSWWDQSICDVYKFSGRNVSQVMNNTILFYLQKHCNNRIPHWCK